MSRRARTPARREWSLALLCLASFVAVVDTTILSVALPSVRRAMGFSPGGVQWVLNAYALVFGGMLLLFGRLADVHGRRRVFLQGLAVFGAGSVLAGLAWDQVSLIAGRVLQGAGAAAFVPASLALVVATFREPAERSRAVGAYGAMAGAGFVVGMVGGGVVTELWGWRWTFLVNVPVVLLALVAGRRLLDESTGESRGRRVDGVGAVVVTGGLVLTVLAVTTAAQRGPSAPATLLPAALGRLALAGFVVLERRHPDPLVPPSVVATRGVVVANGAVALQSMVGIAWLYVLTLFFQEVLGNGPLHTGLLFAPMTVASVVAAAWAGAVVSRAGVRAAALAGLCGVALGLGLMLAGLTPDRPLWVVVVGMVVGEAGFMLASVALTVAGTGAVGDERSGLAAGLLNTSMQLGGGWGLGVTSAVVGGALAAGDTSPAGYAAALRWGLVSCLVFAALGLLVVGAGLRPRTGAGPRPGPAVAAGPGPRVRQR
jgi:EmrB/QacA subfamily drug resistance transporter